MNDKECKQARQRLKTARRLAFSQFVASKKLNIGESVVETWRCCDCDYTCLQFIHKHVSGYHQRDVNSAADEILKSGSVLARWSALKARQEYPAVDDEQNLPVQFTEDDSYPWLPKVEPATPAAQQGRVLLFYKYRHIYNVVHVRKWQQCLCERLSLTGKVRVAAEGLNATVAGSIPHTQVYMDAVRAHPLFSTMSVHDFKMSNGGAEVFPSGLKVGIYEEACPMGISPHTISHENTGVHLSPEEFHQMLQAQSTMETKDALLIDCRNFYESKIGKFSGALAPDIRKFSYWPEYVDANADMFKDKKVLMYCTGGIRCERGSAYLKAKGLCKEVYQLEGGIHKYIEKFPDGHFRGKLFVFDDRYAIKANDDVLSVCRYCSTPWDTYQPCSSGHCHQLVLICGDCRGRHFTTCCPLCAQHAASSTTKEECQCTAGRPRIPCETSDSLENR